MIFKNKKSDSLKILSPLERIHARIEHLNALQMCVLDASEDNGILVVFCNEETMEKFVKLSLEKHWPGKVETYCPASLVTGSRIAGNIGPEEYENIAASSRYLN